VEEGRLIQSEVIGTSDGSPNQRYPLSHPKLILRPVSSTTQATPDITLTTQLGVTIGTWNPQETLAFSRAAQQDYVIDIDENDEASVVFGDGNFGAVPPAGATIQVSYRVGGGPNGNVPAGAIQTIVGASQLALLGAQITNLYPTTGGAERESIQYAVAHAPAVFRSLKRAVTAADYVALALSFQGVGKVQAQATGWNTVTLYVAPSGGGKVSDTLEASLKAYFEDKRMVSQIVEVADVDYVPIYVTAQIGIQSYYVVPDVQANVQQAAASLLAFDNVDFGQTIYLSKFYEVAEQVPGVVFVNIIEFRRGDVSTLVEPTGKITLTPQEVPTIPTDAAYTSGIQVVVVNEGGSGS
jgi:predicted phage baseplate assembly protein